MKEEQTFVCYTCGERMYASKVTLHNKNHDIVPLEYVGGRNITQCLTCKHCKVSDLNAAAKTCSVQQHKAIEILNRENMCVKYTPTFFERIMSMFRRI